MKQRSGEFSANNRSLVLNMLQWPDKQILPVLDLCRIAMCHTNARRLLEADPAFFTNLLDHAKGGTTHLSLVLKAMSNWISKRDKTPQERFSFNFPSVNICECWFVIVLL